MFWQEINCGCADIRIIISPNTDALRDMIDGFCGTDKSFFSICVKKNCQVRIYVFAAVTFSPASKL